ncbi:hypothetical protein SAMN05519103_04519 [Rhizobiales bacterium GAS113]|nr:hypothetical protein SAMN05519103_04519 [Rhizobiales bacterium GAS113]
MIRRGSIGVRGRPPTEAPALSDVARPQLLAIVAGLCGSLILNCRHRSHQAVASRCERRRETKMSMAPSAAAGNTVAAIPAQPNRPSSTPEK